MRIGELAKKAGVNTATIRYYERLGLLTAARAANGYRQYDPASKERLGFIRDAQAAGLTLPEIGMILDMKAEGESTCDHVVLMLEEHLSAVDRQAEELRRTRQRLQETLDRARQLDPTECLDPNRCQTIAPRHEAVAPRTERQNMTTRTTLSVPEIHCDHCKSSLEGAVGALDGIDFVSVSVPEATVEVGYDDNAVSLATIKETIEEQGYAVAN